MPILAEICRLCSATRKAREIRLTCLAATPRASSGSCISTSSTNSSPPIRARVSWLCRWPRRRSATSLSSRSPIWWPKASLTGLKPSRSMNIRAKQPPCSATLLIAWSMRSASSVRLGKPVRVSCRASWVSSWLARVNERASSAVRASRRASSTEVSSATANTARVVISTR
ncbi:hypothetical protein D9M71_399330 [compost metagenome]